MRNYFNQNDTPDAEGQKLRRKWYGWSKAFAVPVPLGVVSRARVSATNEREIFLRVWLRLGSPGSTPRGGVIIYSPLPCLSLLPTCPPFLTFHTYSRGRLFRRARELARALSQPRRLIVCLSPPVCPSVYPAPTSASSAAEQSTCGLLVGQFMPSLAAYSTYCVRFFQIANSRPLPVPAKL